MKIILASGSPRRKELLKQAGYDFTVEVSDADENVIEESPERMVMELSKRKAQAVAMLHDCDEVLVIGSDTVVALNSHILGKPKDASEAMEMLKSLSDNTHQVYTGVTLILIKEDREAQIISFFEKTDVSMKKLEDEEIEEYIATGEPMDKAGAYGIQGGAARFITGIHGDYYNVVGLPICHTAAAIKEMTGV